MLLISLSMMVIQVRIVEHHHIHQRTNFIIIILTIGDSCADFLSKNLLKIALTEESKADGLSGNTLLSSDERIKSGFMKADAAFEKAGEGVDDSGTTAITTFVKRVAHDKLELICANTGDSRCVLFNEGKTEPMSYDHKPTNQLERDRIHKAGSFVEFSRVNGSLAVSRAFGDLSYKKSQKVPPEEQAVTALPEIKRVTVSLDKSKKKDFSFLILACDGIWDVMSNEDATKFVRDRLIKQRDGKYIPSSASTDSEFDDAVQPKSYRNGEYDLGAICEDMLDYCVKCLDSKDNVSVIIVLFESL
jgi:serine/threonine protein phosphatase PrpC